MQIEQGRLQEVIAEAEEELQHQQDAAALGMLPRCVHFYLATGPHNVHVSYTRLITHVVTHSHTR